ncbi:SLC36A4 family protein [Megaselia abdita]
MRETMSGDIEKNNNARKASVGQEKEQKKEDPHGGSDHPTSYLETLMHMFKGNVGAGLFAMGDAFKNGGIVVSPILTIILAVICVHCEHILVKSSRKAQELCKTIQTFDYAETVLKTFENGPKRFQCVANAMYTIVQVLVCITQMGFCCIYFVFITENLEQLFHHYGLNWDSSVIMALMLLPIIIPSLITNLKYLAPVSMLANICLSIGLVVTMVCAFKDGLPSPSERHYYTNGSQMALYFGTVLFSFEGIALVLPLRNSMKKPEKFSGPLGVLNVGMAVIAFLFTFTGFFGYLKWGEEVAGSLTLNVPIDTWYGQLVKISASLGVFFGYPLQFYVPVKIMWPGVKKVFKVQKHPLIGEIIFRACLVVCTYKHLSSRLALAMNLTSWKLDFGIFRKTSILIIAFILLFSFIEFLSNLLNFFVI